MSVHWAPLRKLALSSLFCPIWYLHTLTIIPFIFLFFRLNKPSSLSLSSYGRHSKTFITFVALHSSSMSLLYQAAQNWHSTPGRSYQGWAEGNYHFLWLANHTLPDAVLDTINLCCEGTFLACFYLGIYQDHHIFPCQAALDQTCSQCLGLFPPQVQNFSFPCVEFLLTHFFSLLQSSWMAAQPYGVSATAPSFVTSADMLQLNRIGPGVEPWHTPLMTGLQLDFMRLITTLWALQLSRFSIHLTAHWFTLYFTSLFMRILWGTVSKSEVSVNIS